MALWRTYLSEIHAFSSWQFSNTGCHFSDDYILKWKRKQWDILDTSMPHMLEMPSYWHKVFYDHFQTTKLDTWRCIQSSQSHCWYQDWQVVQLSPPKCHRSYLLNQASDFCSCNLLHFFSTGLYFFAHYVRPVIFYWLIWRIYTFALTSALNSG